MVALSLERKAVEITWDTELVQGDLVNIKTENLDPNAAEADRFSGRNDVQNDGRATLTFPKEYTGTSHVTVFGSGDAADEGDISV
jgi:hypothetical protein